MHSEFFLFLYCIFTWTTIICIKDKWDGRSNLKHGQMLSQGQCTAAKVVRWDDSHSHFCRSSCPLRSDCWYYPFFPSWAISSWVSQSKQDQSVVGSMLLIRARVTSDYSTRRSTSYHASTLVCYCTMRFVWLRTCYEQEPPLINSKLPCISMLWQINISL